MTDPIGTAQERDLIERLRFYGEVYAYQTEAADALQSRIAEVGRLEERVATLAEARTALESELSREQQQRMYWQERAALSLHRRPT